MHAIKTNSIARFNNYRRILEEWQDYRYRWGGCKDIRHNRKGCFLAALRSGNIEMIEKLAREIPMDEPMDKYQNRYPLDFAIETLDNNIVRLISRLSKKCLPKSSVFHSSNKDYMKKVYEELEKESDEESNEANMPKRMKKMKTLKSLNSEKKPKKMRKCKISGAI